MKSLQGQIDEIDLGNLVLDWKLKARMSKQNFQKRCESLNSVSVIVLQKRMVNEAKTAILSHTLLRTIMPLVVYITLLLLVFFFSRFDDIVQHVSWLLLVKQFLS